MKRRTRIVNMTDDLTLDIGDLKLTELIKQAYSNCEFSAGIVEGHPVDTLYIALSRQEDGKEKTGMTLFLRPDEVAALAWVATGVLWSVTLDEVETEP